MRVEETLTFFTGPPFELVITTDLELELAGGAGRLLEPVNPEWTPPMIDSYTSPSLSVRGTARCSGGGCDLVAFPQGVDLPYDELLQMLSNAAPSPTASLAPWAFTGQPDPFAELRDGCIDRFDWTCDSGPGIVIALSQAGDWATAVRILGVAVPEPASARLLAAALAALALRRIA
jgi:hypothetical protein